MISRTHLRVVIGVLVAMAAASAAAWPWLPDRVPVHWGLSGTPDRYGSRWELALAVPLLAVAVSALLLVLPRVGPFRDNIARFAKTYGRVVIAFALVMLVMHAVTLLVALGVPLPVHVVTPVVVGLLLAVLGNWMGKIRRNFWIGIRTPWTLANDTVWERTHRLGGRLFMLYGLVVIPLALFAPPIVTVAWLIGGVIVLVVWSLAYSLWLYRRLRAADDL